MNNKLFNLLMYMYFSGQIKSFLFCGDCQDHFMFYIDDKKDIETVMKRIFEIMGKPEAQLEEGKTVSWMNNSTEVTFGTFVTKDNEDESQGKLRIEVDLMQGQTFDDLLRNLYVLEAAGASDE